MMNFTEGFTQNAASSILVIISHNVSSQAPQTGRRFNKLTID
jgi:hypothetical protein